MKLKGPESSRRLTIILVPIFVVVPRAIKAIPKTNGKGLTPLKFEHLLILALGLALIPLADNLYHGITSVAQVIVLILYLGFLVGIAPIPLPVFRRKFWQVMFPGILSGIIDSYIVLEQSKKLRTVETGQDPEEVMNRADNQETEGVRAKFLALITIAALIGGLIIWFGEVYAAGLYNNDARTGVLSALYIVPPVLVFLTILGFHAERLPITVVPNHSQKLRKRDLGEFGVGITFLLLTHNPLLCLGGLFVYAIITRQDDHLLDIWEHHMEKNVLLVLLFALVAGSYIVEHFIDPAGLGTGEWFPIIPATMQSVLWGPLYEDSTVDFWVRLRTLSTGALLLPISSLVGIMLFRTGKQWLIYMRYSIWYAIIWYSLMWSWTWLTLDSPIGSFLERWAHSGTSH